MVKWILASAVLAILVSQAVALRGAERELNLFGNYEPFKAEEGHTVNDQGQVKTEEKEASVESKPEKESEPKESETKDGSKETEEEAGIDEEQEAVEVRDENESEPNKETGYEELAAEDKDIDNKAHEKEPFPENQESTEEEKDIVDGEDVVNETEAEPKDEYKEAEEEAGIDEEQEAIDEEEVIVGEKNEEVEVSEEMEEEMEEYVEKVVEHPDPVDRRNPMDSSLQFAFVHTLLCAGGAFIKAFHSVLGENIFPQSPGPHMTVPFTKIMHPVDYTMTSVRNPREQLWSMYSKCRYGGASSKLKKELWQYNDKRGFDHWLSYFLDGKNNFNTKSGRFDYGCIHPANVLSRTMLSEEASSQHLDSAGTWEPDEYLAVEVLRSLEWVGLAEFHHESICLMFYRLMLAGNAGSDVEDYVENRCHCNNHELAKVDHRRNRDSLTTLPKATLAKADALTYADTTVFLAALDDFLSEVVWMENGLKRRVICENSLKAVEPEIAYLDVSVSQMYHELSSFD